MVDFKILAGGLSSFVATYLFNPDQKSLTLMNQTSMTSAPTWVMSHPRSRNTIYTVNELHGSISSFTLDGNTGQLNLVETHETGGNTPSFCDVLT
ncbi:hypothetical protein CPC08DRAFT_817320 [Agrocybe pediades]|nr:hypothetical protein CPC08DRAFT_817320 [Agrocybe pediades]